MHVTLKVSYMLQLNMADLLLTQLLTSSQIQILQPAGPTEIFLLPAFMLCPHYHLCCALLCWQTSLGQQLNFSRVAAYSSFSFLSELETSVAHVFHEVPLLGCGACGSLIWLLALQR